MPPKPKGDRPMTGAEREAKRRARIKQDRALADEALTFLLTLEGADAYSMPWQKRQKLNKLQTKARIKRAETLP